MAPRRGDGQREAARSRSVATPSPKTSCRPRSCARSSGASGTTSHARCGRGWSASWRASRRAPAATPLDGAAVRELADLVGEALESLPSPRCTAAASPPCAQRSSRTRHGSPAGLRPQPRQRRSGWVAPPSSWVSARRGSAGPGMFRRRRRAVRSRRRTPPSWRRAVRRMPSARRRSASRTRPRPMRTATTRRRRAILSPRPAGPARGCATARSTRPGSGSSERASRSSATSRTMAARTSS